MYAQYIHMQSSKANARWIVTANSLDRMLTPVPVQDTRFHLSHKAATGKLCLSRNML